MAIEFNCPSCDHHIRTKSEYAGRHAKCPKCTAPLTVPHAEVELTENNSVVSTSSQQIQTPAHQQVTHGTSYTQVKVEQDKGNGAALGLGVGALVMGIIALLSSWIPIVGCVSLPFVCIGLLLSLLGVIMALTTKGRGIGFPIAGGVTCIVAGVIWFVVTGATATALGEAGKQLQAQIEAEQRKRDQALQHAMQSSGEESVAVSTESPSNPTLDALSSGQTAILGTCEIMFVSAQIGKPGIQQYDGKIATGENDQLIVIVQVLNTSDTKKVNYTTFMGSDFSFGAGVASLKDEHLNTYKRITYGIDDRRVVGRTTQASIHPHQSVTDTLIFEIPIEQANAFVLELPGTSIEAEGTALLGFNSADIER